MATIRQVVWPIPVAELKKMLNFIEDQELGKLGVNALSQQDLKVGRMWVSGVKTDEEFIEQLGVVPGKGNNLVPEDFFEDEANVDEDEPIEPSNSKRRRVKK